MNLKTLLAISAIFSANQCVASDRQQFELSFENNHVVPAEIVIPANTKVQLVVHNRDEGVEEFHSDSLQREKIISGNSSGLINIGPLAPGIYSFMGEFHAETAQGRIVVK